MGVQGSGVRGAATESGSAPVETGVTDGQWNGRTRVRTRAEIAIQRVRAVYVLVLVLQALAGRRVEQRQPCGIRVVGDVGELHAQRELSRRADARVVVVVRLVAEPRDCHDSLDDGLRETVGAQLVGVRVRVLDDIVQPAGRLGFAVATDRVTLLSAASGLDERFPDT